jgi:hypothetical protein
MDIVGQIRQRRMQVLVHSYLYYQLDTSIISDHTFDRWCNELVQLTEQYPEEASQVIYHKEFEGFDGSTGCDLPFSYPHIQSIGNKILKYHKRMKLETINSIRGKLGRELL